MKRWSQTLLISLVVVLSSQVYWNIFSDDFRVSISVAVLPVLLVTMGREKRALEIGTFTGICIFSARFLLMMFESGMLPGEAVRTVFPGAVFYVFYGLLFALWHWRCWCKTFPRLIICIFTCDVLGNLFELFMRSDFPVHRILERCWYLVEIGALRTLLAGAMLAVAQRYHSLLAHSEHENRYQRLFQLTTGLKNETYFMKKNSEEIETIMGNAYRLYEQCAALEVPEETRKLALAIARDVHEIKKDYLRIIQGIEKELDEQCAGEQMRLQDLLQILRVSTLRQLYVRALDIRLEFYCADDFVTTEHYALMAVLKNLVTNAAEAIESVRKSGVIRLTEAQVGDWYVFYVTDDGPGISEKNLPRVFQMGFSTKYNEKTGNIYRGVGLSGVRIMVEEHFKGRIEVSSHSGQGASFRLELPAGILTGEPAQ